MQEHHPPPVARFIGAIVGLVFAGAGLTLLIFLWGAPFGEFGSPPLFFRVFASFIAIAFVGVGSASAYAAIAGKMPQPRGLHRRHVGSSRISGGPVSNARYVCPQCAAALESGADVSPHGDTKCPYCGSWFNVHSGS
ncbi:MAG: hypothetical protein ACOY3P_18235 [Planctomycetota bacterium]